MVQRVSGEVLDRLRMEERFECWNRGEFDLMLEPYAEDALFDVSSVFTDVAPVRGHADMRRSWEEAEQKSISASPCSTTSARPVKS
jgi:hypothetical protein